MNQIKCPCGALLNLRPEVGGQSVRCPKCTHVIRVPDSGSIRQSQMLSVAPDPTPQAQSSYSASRFRKRSWKKKKSSTNKILTNVLIGVVSIVVAVVGIYAASSLVGLASSIKDDQIAQNGEDQPRRRVRKRKPTKKQEKKKSPDLVYERPSNSDSTESTNSASVTGIASGLASNSDSGSDRINAVPPVIKTYQDDGDEGETFGGGNGFLGNQGAGLDRGLDGRSFEKIVKPVSPQMFELDDAPGVARSFDTFGGAVMNLSMSPDKKYLAATSRDGTVFVFDFSIGKLLYKIVSKNKLIRKTAFSKRPLRLLTVSDQSSETPIAIRNPKTGEIIRSVDEPGDFSARSVAVSANSRSIFASWDSDGDSSWRFWRFDVIDDTSHESDLGYSFASFNDGDSQPTCSMFSKDSRFLLTTFNNGWLTASTGAGQNVERVGAMQIHAGMIRDMALSPDGKKIVSGGEDGQLTITDWNRKSWKVMPVGESEDEILGVDYGANGSMVAASRANMMIGVYDAKTRKIQSNIETDAICTSVKFFDDDKFIVAGCKDGQIRIYPVGQ